jgi:AraC-like DNA-binding protein
MSRLFEPVVFSGKPVVWGYRSSARMPAQGYYHWHQCCEILIVHQGSGIVSVNSQNFEIRKGTLFFFQPFELHKVFAEPNPDVPYVRTLIHVDPVFLEEHLRPFPRRLDLFERLVKSPTAPHAFHLGDLLAEVDDCCNQYDQAVRDGVGHHTEEIVLLFARLLTSIRQAMPGISAEKQEERRPARYSERIMRWLDTHFADPFVLDRLAEDLHLSKFYVSRLFRRETGSSITEYLTARRIMRACHLLETTDLSVEQVGAKVGLPNTSHFIHTFKKTVGTTPLKYRRGQCGPLKHPRS